MIGSNLVHGLNAIGIDDVIAVDDLTEARNSAISSAPAISDYFDRIEFYDRFALGELGRVDAVFHEGACSDTMEHNGRLHAGDQLPLLARTCSMSARPQGTRLLYASSAATYGDSSTFP